MDNPWICCQIGAREHYAIPKSLIKSGNTVYLFTDFWATPSNFYSALLPDGMQQRYCSELDGASVKGFNFSSIYFEIIQRTINKSRWEKILARNSWFQRQVLKKLKHIKFSAEQRPVLFSYSYAALELFRYAKSRGWKTILGQIDPGPVEEKIVLGEHKNRSEYIFSWEKAPSSYWENWSEECELADKIIVNSSWSSDALFQAGISRDKIEIVPLVYNCSDNVPKKMYPKTFSRERPLQVLFLGQVVMRKGIAALLDAAKLLQGEPVEFIIVGRMDIEPPEFHKKNRHLRWIGQVSRRETKKYYRDADIFLFPTLSDGFGLTQLEAQYWKLPTIASHYCGQVVIDGVNGFLLDEVSGTAIANILRKCLSSPELLQKMSDLSSVKSKFSLTELPRTLKNIVSEA